MKRVKRKHLCDFNLKTTLPSLINARWDRPLVEVVHCRCGRKKPKKPKPRRWTAWAVVHEHDPSYCSVWSHVPPRPSNKAFKVIKIKIEEQLPNKKQEARSER